MRQLVHNIRRRVPNMPNIPPKVRIIRGPPPVRPMLLSEPPTVQILVGIAQFIGRQGMGPAARNTPRPVRSTAQTVRGLICDFHLKSFGRRPLYGPNRPRFNSRFSP